MIGAFARMVGSRQRVLNVEQTEENGYSVNATGEAGLEQHAEARDAPPVSFSQRFRDEGGDVYLVPLLEMLREALRRKRGEAKEEASAEDGTV